MIVGSDVPKYMPDIKYIWTLAQCDAWIFLDSVPVRQDFPRANIKTQNGRMVLTVPIQRTTEPLKDVKILSSGSWQSQHWNAISRAYAGCKHHHYRDMFRGILLSQRWTHIATLNIKVIKFVCKMLQIKTKLFRESVHGMEFADATELRGPSFESKPYPQLHGKFMPNLSIVDYICNTGGAGKYEITEFFSAK